MRQLAGLVGIVVTVGLVIQMLNLVSKWVFRRWISKLPPQKKNIKDLYTYCMRLLIKIHKPVGVCITVVVFAHLMLMLLYRRLSLTGVVSLTLMVVTSLIALVAVAMKLKPTKWLKLHRLSAFLLSAAVLIHLLF